MRSLFELTKQHSDGIRKSLPMRVVDLAMDEALQIDEASFISAFHTIQGIADELHGHHCNHGAECATFELVDAHIYVMIMQPWQSGAYKSADDRDYAIMRRSVLAMANYRRVIE